METRRWLNQSQPQTLVIAVMLMYLDAVFLLLFGGAFSVIGIALVAGYVAAGYGISNERKWGYVLGVVIASLGVLFIVLPMLAFGFGVGGSVINLLFAVAKLALLLHPQSREYQRIWFK